ncbi:malate/lactate/ureidoglycolate dehydrogenase [Roseococcus suduntuyensis]|uniref:Putative oxidoreductase n=1 Tax=Roseococcus suduntuyensis TaxID=455361 RepID=A0A840A9U0_9PROT|nr:malate/lactate/ureidoglycolate dehydrogenase [Roseococcus suduntuyensis]MBB3897074.1 putative oxidoreductase [Roseococcus suduntuyensis]
MAEPDYMYIPVEELEGFVTRIFAASGCSATEAARISNHLVGANLSGHDSHGVVRVPRYVEWQKAGHVVAGQKVEVVTDGGAFALLDGKFGFGQTVAQQAAEFGIARALAQGCCIVGLRNAGHIGRTGDYAEMAAEQGLISVHFVNVAGSVLVAPFGGAERRFSTAPFSVGVKLPSGPVILDFATSFVAEGKVLVASNGGKALPENALVTADGRMSGDPHTLYGDYPEVGPRNPSGGTGAIRAFGDHKGSGLAFMCELLAGALTGGGCSGPITERGRIANGMLSIYLSPSHFADEAAFHEAAQNYLDWVKSCRPIDADAPVLAPGEPEKTRRAERMVSGVPITRETWQSILDTAAGLGINGP